MELRSAGKDKFTTPLSRHSHVHSRPSLKSEVTITGHVYTIFLTAVMVLISIYSSFSHIINSVIRLTSLVIIFFFFYNLQLECFSYLPSLWHCPLILSPLPSPCYSLNSTHILKQPSLSLNSKVHHSLCNLFTCLPHCLLPTHFIPWPLPSSCPLSPYPPPITLALQTLHLPPCYKNIKRVE